MFFAIKNKYKLFSFYSFLLIVVVILSGCLNTEPPPLPGQQIEESTEKKEVISQNTTNEFENDTGIIVNDITIKPKGTLGGDVFFQVVNDSDEECGGLVVQVDMLSETNDVIVTLGVQAPKAIKPGQEMEIKDLFIGKGVVKANITSITCDFARFIPEGTR
ncbi:MAG: hypothetical protein CL780_04330 [Chloroflexi bacterium]|nr:hypothetical protein [Chloroflexota bacterium]|tara:strand:- start:386 stop:868 length:483 start_codon:yes stop_codon:yes gene_type:complete